MLRSFTASQSKLVPRSKTTFSIFTRLNSSKVNFHRPDQAGSNDAADAADASATVLADKNDYLRVRLESKNSPNKTTWLNALNERKKQLEQGKVLDSFAYMTPKTTAVGEKTRNESFSYLTLPFKDDEWLCDSYINAAGRLRVGQLFQDLDALAGRIAYRHCSPAEPVNVTASVDRIYMVKKVDELQNYNFVLAGSVTWTGRSSMEISVKGYAFENEVPADINESVLPADKVFLTANFTFVARNPETHKSFPINKLLPVSEKEWLDFRRAESHNASKKLAAKNADLQSTPSAAESMLIHKMWTESRLLEANENTKPKNLVFMKDTKISSTLFMQPQYRNRHSYMIFGGYLLRQTFELAYCASAAFSHAPPRFVSLDSTTFKAPVPVGSVLYMNASVSYTEHIHNGDESAPKNFGLVATNKLALESNDFLSQEGTLVQVKVDTTIRALEHDTHKESGSFIYSFFVPKETEGNVTGYCTVIPQTYSEMMEYVEGRRRARDTANYVDTIKRTNN